MQVSISSSNAVLWVFTASNCSACLQYVQQNILQRELERLDYKVLQDMCFPKHEHTRDAMHSDVMLQACQQFQKASLAIG